MIAGVRLNKKGKVSYFDDNFLELKIGLDVIVETEKGMEYGTVVCFLNNKLVDKNFNYNKIIRIAQEKDYFKFLDNIKDANDSINKCKELIKKYNLKMRLLDAVYTFDRSQLLFRFLADERVDFRKLARELGSYYKTRIELRQVGIRDKARVIGGIGPCGRPMCCSSFLNSFETVTISMAKNQMLALNPTKINGVCGRLLCCLAYEDETYTNLRKGLPSVGDTYIHNKEKYKVIDVDIYTRKIKIENEEHIQDEVFL